MTAWAEQDYERADGRDADQVTASPNLLRTEFEHGQSTAGQLTERSAEGGQGADHIEARHLELDGPTGDESQRTPAKGAWWNGYTSGAETSLALLRDLEMEAGS